MYFLEMKYDEKKPYIDVMAIAQPNHFTLDNVDESEDDEVLLRPPGDKDVGVAVSGSFPFFAWDG
jgi:hypothetical protein